MRWLEHLTKQSRRTPSRSSRGGLLGNQVSVLIRALTPVLALADTMDVSNLTGILLPGVRHRRTSVIRVIKVSGRR
jgi:hypothetical protein